MTKEVIYQRMLASAPEYYHTSEVYKQIQDTVATELANVRADTKDIKKQLHVRTATWGLKYWERAVSIVTIEADSYAVRRSRVLGKLRSIGNFSVAMIRSIAKAYTENELLIDLDLETGIFTIEFTGDFPADVNSFQKQLNDVIHAHLGARYQLRITGPAIIVTGKMRGYVVPLPICNMFHATSDEYGKRIAGSPTVQFKQRGFIVEYPICNTFYPGGLLYDGD